MKNSLKICKYQLGKSLKFLGIYYGVLCIAVILGFILKRMYIDTRLSDWITEYYTVIVLFVLGLVAFKRTFSFAQGNNVSRKSYYKGIVLHIFCISAFLPIVDIIINKILNLFFYDPIYYCPMIYDVFYTSDAERDIFTGSLTYFTEPIIDNSAFGLFSNYLFLFSFYLFAFLVGLLCSLIISKFKGIGKVVFSIIIGFIFMNMRLVIFPADIVNTLLGIDIYNSYNAVLTNLVMGIIIIRYGYLLIKRAEATGYKSKR